MINDEVLGAYIDDELHPAERVEVERACAENKGAALRLQRLRGADDLVRQAVGVEAAEANDPLAQLIMNGQPGPGRQVSLRSWGRGLAALAAACLLGVFAGRASAPEGLVAPDMSVGRVLASLLEDRPSGAVAAIPGGQVEVALSFRAGDGAICRQFRATSGTRVNDGLACRDGDGWRVIVQAAVADSQAFRTANASDPIANAVETLGGASVLDAAEERELIESHWR